jgi:glycerol-3-phosphate dehydrogenase (NAD(P)+)
MRIAVLGAGAWGSALAMSLSSHHEVSLWTRDARARAALARDRVSRYLPDAALPAAVRVASELSGALDEADCVLVATSTAGLRETAQALAAARGDAPVVWACKGFESGTGKLPHQVVDEVLPRSRRRGALSGPSFALEVARGQPTAIVLASNDGGFAAEAAAALNSARLRVYSSDDLAGVELGGALKNVIAIAAGISDGLDLGRNARAALVTRGLAEITRLGTAMGGRPETFAGLAGLGDLVLTCTGDLSRNREVGMRLAAGKPLEDILAGLGHVSEGVLSARAALGHARDHGVEMPITEAVCAVLFDARPPREAVQQLLARDPRPE